jgi:ornithine cyclodeaminase/alanine dehydrogenase-like protein (mu-crystallin family)
VISEARIEGELADLVSGRVTGRCHDQEIILFKSVGTAVEDLAVAQMIVKRAR